MSEASEIAAIDIAAIDDDPPPVALGHTVLEQRVVSLTTANRALAARNGVLRDGILACITDLERFAEQAGAFIGVATQASVRQRIARMRDTLAQPPASPEGC